MAVVVAEDNMTNEETWLISFTLQQDTYELLTKAAKDQNLSIEDFIIYASIQRAKDNERDRNIFEALNELTPYQLPERNQLLNQD